MDKPTRTREELEAACKANFVPVDDVRREDFLIPRDTEELQLKHLRQFVAKLAALPDDTMVRHIHEYEGDGIGVDWSEPLSDEALEAALAEKLALMAAYAEKLRAQRRKEYLKLKAEFEPDTTK